MNSGARSMFVLLQTEESFVRALPASRQRSLAETCARIRHEFEQGGRAYDVSITLSPYEAHRYLKPLKPGDPVVRWWELANDAPSPPQSDASISIAEPDDVCFYQQ